MPHVDNLAHRDSVRLLRRDGPQGADLRRQRDVRSAGCIGRNIHGLAGSRNGLDVGGDA